MPSRNEILDFDDAPPPAGASPWVVEPIAAQIEIVEYDPMWPAQAQEVSQRLSSALQLRALRIEHVGSTSVPGLPAKPVIDVDVTVADPADESAWLPRLQDAGFVLTVREPWWHEHRMLRGRARADDGATPADAGPAVNVHVFGPDSPELVRHIVFRNWLRANADDRERYARAKQSAAADGGTQQVVEYNARKQATIRDIYAHAFQAAGFFD